MCIEWSREESRSKWIRQEAKGNHGRTLDYGKKGSGPASWEAIALSQARDVGGSYHGNSAGVKNWADSRYVLQIDPIELADRLEMGWKRKRSHQESPQDYSLERLQ